LKTFLRYSQFFNLSDTYFYVNILISNKILLVMHFSVSSTKRNLLSQNL